MQHIYVLTATTENTLRVLQRVATIFTRYRINIEQLNVFETGKKGLSHFSIVLHADDKVVDKLMKQLMRIVELLDVNINSKLPLTQQPIGEQHDND